MRSDRFGWLGSRASLDVDARSDRLDSNELPDVDRTTVGVFLQDELRLLEDRVSLVPGLRFDDTQGFGSEWIPRFGASLQPWSWLRVKGNVERSYRVPNFDELYFPDKGFIRGNPSLAPEEAINYDVGFELAFERVGPLSNVALRGRLLPQPDRRVDRLRPDQPVHGRAAQHGRGDGAGRRAGGRREPDALAAAARELHLPRRHARRHRNAAARPREQRGDGARRVRAAVGRGAAGLRVDLHQLDSDHLHRPDADLRADRAQREPLDQPRARVLAAELASARRTWCCRSAGPT